MSVSDAAFQNQIGVYPNPTVDGRIIISGGDIQFTNPSIRLIDLLGRTVRMQILSGRMYEIQMDVKDLSEGVYMIEIFSEGKTYRAKLLKRK